MAAYLSLEDAAKQLGIPAEKLIDLRSQGQIRGFRDGASWKFPESEIERMRDELPNLSGFGSGILGSEDGGSKLGNVIGGDDQSAGNASGEGSDIDLGLESASDPTGSDVNLIASEGVDSDVTIVPGGAPKADPPKGDSEASDAPLAIDLDDLEISGSAISHDSGSLDLGGDTGGSTAPASGNPTPSMDESELNLEPADRNASKSSEVGGESDADIDLGISSPDAGASSLELMDNLDLGDESASGKSSDDVLSELDLLAGEAAGSGVLSGDSANLLGSSLVSAGDGGSSGVDEALGDDDDLIIADDDDDLVVSGAGSDISIAGDSGINLMSPSDSGLSLESEPLDLAGSSISALDLGVELGDGSGTGSGNVGSGLGSGAAGGSSLDFPDNEEFQLSPSGISINQVEESGSQEIEIEDSIEAEPAEVAMDGDDGFGDADFGAEGVEFEPQQPGEVGFEDGSGFEDSGLQDDSSGVDSLSTSGAGAPVRAGTVGYEVPFTLLQTVSLLLILVVLSLGGMLMTDLIRNMWAYSETSAPVSGLTDGLIGLMGWGQ